MQTLAAIGIVLATTLWAVGATAGNQHVVRVCLGTDLKEKEYALLPLVKAKTSKLFATIGIRLEWTEDRRYCHNDSGAIRLSVRRQAAPASGPDGLGYALPYDRGQVVAFYDRVVSSRGIVSIEDMLSYVFAHEIAHGTDGSFPVGGVIQTMSGTRYGVTAKLGKTAGGRWASGEVYSLTGLPPC